MFECICFFPIFFYLAHIGGVAQLQQQQTNKLRVDCHRFYFSSFLFRGYKVTLVEVGRFIFLAIEGCRVMGSPGWGRKRVRLFPDRLGELCDSQNFIKDIR